MSAAADAFARASFAAWAASLTPLVGVELEPGEPEIAPETAPPEGDLAVLPVVLERDAGPAGALAFYGPVAAIARLARRTLGDAEPDKEREPSKDELDAIGQVLNLAGGAIDAAVHSHLDPGLRVRLPGWWRSTAKPSVSLEAGPHVVARCALAVAGAGAVGVSIRIPEAVLGAAAGARPTGSVVLLGFDDATREPLERVLGGARFDVRADALDAAARGDGLGPAAAVLIAGDADGALAACRRLRLGNASWRTPAVICLREPTRARVLEALANGASHVLRIPADDATILRVLEASRA